MDRERLDQQWGPNHGWAKNLLLAAVFLALLIAIYLTFFAEVRDRLAGSFPFAPDLHLANPISLTTSESVTVHETPLPSLRGYTQPFASITLTMNGRFVDKVRTNYNGYFSFDPTPLNAGYNYFALSVDGSGAWLERQQTLRRTVRYVPIPPTLPTIVDVAQNEATDELQIIGVADPSARVSVELGPDISGSARANDYGLFLITVPAGSVEEDPLTLVRALASGRTDADEEALVTGKPNYLPEEGTHWLREPMSRTLSLNIVRNELRPELRLTLPRNDPRLNDYLTGAIGADAFFDNVVGRLVVNGTTMSSILTSSSSSPEVTVGEQVLLHWIPEEELNIPFSWTQGSLTVRTDALAPAPNSADTIKVIAPEHRVLAMRPPPAQADGETYVWRGPWHTMAPVLEMDLALTRFQAATLLLRTHPQLLLDFPLSSFASLLSEFVRLVPVLWLLIFLYQAGADVTTPNRDAARLRRGAFAALVLACLPLAYQLLTSTQFLLIDLSWLAPFSFSEAFASFLSELNSVSEFQPYAPPIVLAAAGLLLLLVLFLRLLLFFFRSSLAQMIKTWLSALFRAIAGAGALFALFGLIEALGLESFPVVQVAEVALGFGLLAATFLVANAAGDGLFARLNWPTGRLLLVSALLFFPLLYPLQSPPVESDAGLSITATNLSINLFYVLQQVWLYLPLLAAVVLLVPPSLLNTHTGKGRRLSRTLAIILFAAYIVGTQNWMWIPLPLLLAIYLSRYLLRPELEVLKLSFLKDRIHQHREELIRAVISWELADDLKRIDESLDDQLAEGSITPEKHASTRTELTERIEQFRTTRLLPSGINPTETVFAIGPYDSAWENGKWALRWGLFLSLPLLIIYSIAFLRGSIWTGHPYFYLSVLIRLLVFYLDWLVLAFFFGYFFNYLRGENGLKKGLWLAAFIVIAVLPLEIMRIQSTADIPVLVFEMAQRVIFLAMLGLLAFDYTMLRRNGYSWRRLRLISDAPSLTAFGTSVITTAGIAAMAVVTGQVQELVQALVKLALPDIPLP